MSDKSVLEPLTSALAAERGPARPAPDVESPLLSIRGLSVVFDTAGGPVTAVRDADLDLQPRSTLAIVGESGSGKSTLAAAVNGLLASNARVTSGSVVFGGQDLLTRTPAEMSRIRGAGIGLVPQDPMSNLDPVYRIGDQIGETLRAHGVPKRAIRARTIELLAMVGIPDPARRARQFPHEFSGGMRQRVLIAIGLACRPQLLIADEPTSALDVTVQRRVLDELEALTAEMGTALFMITHDLGLAAERADEVLVMFRGSIVEHGPAARILDDPQHEYTRRLLDAAPSLAVRSGAARPLTPWAEHRAAGTGHEDNIVEVSGARREFRTGRRLLSRAAPFVAVDSVDLVVPRGATVAVVGESGSGKSTTARLVLRLDRPTAGRISFDGVDTADLRGAALFSFRKRVQPVFQNPFASLDPLFTVGDTIVEPLVVHGIGTAESRRERLLELLDAVALPDETAERLPHELSGGQRQRVAIARALALRPELIVLDEAVSALDVLVQAQILDLLARLQRELGLSYLFISHDLAVVRQISDLVYVMKNGAIVESGTPEQIFDDPHEGYTRELLAAIPAPRRSA
jgi:peptide/nickel transport system ATP-binding protein